MARPKPKITHLGGEHCVTGSCHLLRVSDLNIMVDCGLSQGGDPALPIGQWPVSPVELDYLFLTHAHIDHIGRLPELIDNGFAGEILCSHPTKALLEPMLHDAMGFSGYDDAGKKAILQHIDELSWGFEYGQAFKLKKGVTFSLGRAGHILGSCFIRFEIAHPEDGKPFSVMFSGDLGNRNTPLLCDPDPPPSCDLLILESTYGDRNHENRRHRLAHLEDALAKALWDKGKVLIPAFALGRTQEILYELDRVFATPSFRARLERAGIHELPVIVDSPLGLRLTEVYGSQREFWDREARELLRRGDDPIDFQGLYACHRYRDHLQLLQHPGPLIIIAGSGMCTGGRILDHLAAGLADPRTDILFVGYQAHHTLGRKIVEQSGRPNGTVTIDGRNVPVRAAVQVLSGYSAHADQQGLLDWVAAMPERPGGIKLVHGEEEARRVLGEKFRAQGYACIVDGAAPR
ncbi:MAG: MBL fold metallo-hydrolase [Thermodesulfobacteriota bacterium]